MFLPYLIVNIIRIVSIVITIICNFFINITCKASSHEDVFKTSILEVVKSSCRFGALDKEYGPSIYSIRK